LLAAKEEYEELLFEVEEAMYSSLDEEEEDDPWGDVDESGEEDEESLESLWGVELPTATLVLVPFELAGDSPRDKSESTALEADASAIPSTSGPTQLATPRTGAQVEESREKSEFDDHAVADELERWLGLVDCWLNLIDAARTPENVLDVLWFVSLLSLPTGAAQELHLVGSRRGRREPRDRHELVIRPPDPGYRELCLHLPNAPSSTRRLMAA